MNSNDACLLQQAQAQQMHATQNPPPYQAARPDTLAEVYDRKWERLQAARATMNRYEERLAEARESLDQASREYETAWEALQRQHDERIVKEIIET